MKDKEIKRGNFSSSTKSHERNSGSARGLESLGKLWKLKMPFSRNWNVREIFKTAMEKFWIFV